MALLLQQGHGRVAGTGSCRKRQFAQSTVAEFEAFSGRSTSGSRLAVWRWLNLLGDQGSSMSIQGLGMHLCWDHGSYTPQSGLGLAVWAQQHLELLAPLSTHPTSCQWGTKTRLWLPPARGALLVLFQNLAFPGHSLRSSEHLYMKMFCCALRVSELLDTPGQQ
jgi:hypothetical protein